MRGGHEEREQPDRLSPVVVPPHAGLEPRERFRIEIASPATAAHASIVPVTSTWRWADRSRPTTIRPRVRVSSGATCRDGELPGRPRNRRVGAGRRSATRGRADRLSVYDRLAIRRRRMDRNDRSVAVDVPDSARTEASQGWLLDD